MLACAQAARYERNAFARAATPPQRTRLEYAAQRCRDQRNIEANETAAATFVAVYCGLSRALQSEKSPLSACTAMERLYAPPVHKISPSSCLITRSLSAPSCAYGHFFEISRRCPSSFFSLRFLTFALLVCSRVSLLSKIAWPHIRHPAPCPAAHVSHSRSRAQG